METVVRFVGHVMALCPSVLKLYLSRTTVTDYVTSILINLFSQVLTNTILYRYAFGSATVLRRSTVTNEVCLKSYAFGSATEVPKEL